MAKSNACRIDVSELASDQGVGREASTWTQHLFINNYITSKLYLAAAAINTKNGVLEFFDAI